MLFLFFFRRLRTIVLSIKRRFCIKHGENKYQQKFTFKYYVLTPFTLFLVNTFDFYKIFTICWKHGCLLLEFAS